MLEQDFMKEVLKRFDKIDVKLEEHSKKFDKVNAQLARHSKKISNNSLEIAGLTEIVTAHNNTLIKFEHEFKDKFDTLFDSFLVNQDKHVEYEDSLDVLNSKVFNHDIRISALEDLYKTKLA